MDFSVAQQKHQTNLMIPPGDFQPKQDALKIVKTDADFVCRSLVTNLTQHSRPENLKKSRQKNS